MTPEHIDVSGLPPEFVERLRQQAEQARTEIEHDPPTSGPVRFVFGEALSGRNRGEPVQVVNQFGDTKGGEVLKRIGKDACVVNVEGAELVVFERAAAWT